MASGILLKLGNYQYHFHPKKLTDSRGVELPLRLQSLQVLHLLASKPGQLFSKEAIFSVVWPDAVVTDDSLVQCIADIRRALDDQQRQLLQTVPRRGYKLMAQEMASPPVISLTPTAPSAPCIPAVPADRPAIAVMDFQSVGNHPDGKMLALGLATDIQSSLAHISHFFVVARASASCAQPLPSLEASRRLGVRYLVTGVVQLAATRVRVTVSLVDSSCQRILWSEQYERKLSGFLQLQDEMAQAVTHQVESIIQYTETRKAFTVPTESLGAWGLYHRGLSYLSQTNWTGVEAVASLMKQAIALDPGFSSAYAFLSCNAINRHFLRGVGDTQNHVDQALDYAQQSLLHDAHNALGHWALGRALFMKKEHKQALQELDCALALRPSSAWVQYTKAIVTSFTDQGEGALPAAETALCLSPLDPNRFALLGAKSMALLQQQDYRQAAEVAVQATQQPNAYHLTHAQAAVSLQLNGQYEEAKIHIDHTFRLMPAFTLSHYRRSLPHSDEQSPARLRVLQAFQQLGVAD